MYVRNTAPYFQIRTQEWAEYFVCASGCDDCKGRVVRITPVDGRLPYVRASVDQRTSAHSPRCLPSETRIVLRKARQLFFKEVAISVHSSHRRSIRESYNEIRRLLLHNRGSRVVLLLSPTIPVPCRMCYTLYIIYTCLPFNIRTPDSLPLASAPCDRQHCTTEGSQALGCHPEEDGRSHRSAA